MDFECWKKSLKKNFLVQFNFKFIKKILRRIIDY